MNAKFIFALFLFTVLFATGENVFAETNSTNSVGLYVVASTGAGEAVKASDGSVVRLGRRSEIQILKAHVYSMNNENTQFEVYLNTSGYDVNSNADILGGPIVLRIGDHGYAVVSEGGRTNLYDMMTFVISNRTEAEIAAKSLSTDCIVRTNPGYKILARFVPMQSEFNSNEPVLVKFFIKNLDDRTVVFKNGGMQRGWRDNQYGFRAIAHGEPVPDTGNPSNLGGLFTYKSLGPGKEFVDEIDLKKWFSFDKAGTYYIHGFYKLAFYPKTEIDSYASSDLIWTDYASADFEVVVK